MHEPGAVFRDKIKEPREGYFVEYQPADSRFQLATLSLTFFDGQPTASRVAELLEIEVRAWFRRFPVPIFGSAHSDTGDLIDLKSVRASSHFVAHQDPGTREPVEFWFESGIERPTPPEQMTSEYQNAAYSGLPANLAATVREAGLAERRRIVRTGKTIVLLLIVVPICIELISLGVNWIDWILTGASVAAGLFKLAKARGWIKPSERERKKEAEELRMRHHHYHCERNPEAFARLKAENSDRETRKRVLAEAAALKGK